MFGGRISLVLPVYNEVAILQQVLDKYLLDLKQSCKSFEIVAVNDGSTDGTEDILLEYAKLNRNLKVVNLDGRHGKQAAIVAGMDLVDPRSQVVVLADIDILNPVGIIKRVLDLISAGEQIVYARRENFGFDKVKAITSDIWTKLGAKMFGLEGRYTGKSNVSAFTRDVIDVMNTMPERNKYLRTMCPWVGWSIDFITYASGYNKIEEQNIIAQAKKQSEEAPMVKTHKPVARDKVREHTSSIDLVYAFLITAFLIGIFGIIYETVLGGPIWVHLFIWMGFIVLIGLAFVLYTKAILVKRVGVLHKNNSGRLYDIQSVIN